MNIRVEALRDLMNQYGCHSSDPPTEEESIACERPMLNAMIAIEGRNVDNKYWKRQQRATNPAYRAMGDKHATFADLSDSVFHPELGGRRTRRVRKYRSTRRYRKRY